MGETLKARFLKVCKDEGMWQIRRIFWMQGADQLVREYQKAFPHRTTTPSLEEIRIALILKIVDEMYPDPKRR